MSQPILPSRHAFSKWPFLVLLLTIGISSAAVAFTASTKMKQDEIAELRSQLDSIVKLENDGEFLAEIARFFKEKFRLTSYLKHGEWYPIAHSAMLSIDERGVVRFRAKDDSITEFTEMGTWLLMDDGSWAQANTGQEESSSITASVTLNHVFIVNLTTETISVLKRN